MKDFFKKYSNLFIIIFFLLMIFLLIYHVTNCSILANSPYNSYELQAEAWLNGRTYLDHNYPYLELAIYGGHYYVSFPPFPSVFLLPFVIIYGVSMPTNFIIFVIFTISFIVLYLILKRRNYSEFVSILLALSFTIGTNLLSLSINSGVWFIAQVLNNCLCILAVDAFLKNRKTLVYLFLALAVGCRPFSIIYLGMFFLYYVIKDKHKAFYQKILHNLLPLLPALIIGILYMWYNYLRFDNIFEFGHNYLPEHLNSQYGQFSLHYLLSNLKTLFFGYIEINKKLNFTFQMPFCFLVANPIILIYIWHSIKDFWISKKRDLLGIMLFVSIAINILLICMHSTLGAWQFGARYTCDILPFVFLGMIIHKKDDFKLGKYEVAWIIFGVILNIFGAIILHSDKLSLK